MTGPEPLSASGVITAAMSPAAFEDMNQRPFISLMRVVDARPQGTAVTPARGPNSCGGGSP
jgi:hypothetical protein